jgi:arsenate reductase-like glutaredoxin family protein
MSLGELNSVLSQIDLEDLVNTSHKLYHDSLYPYTSDLDQKKNILQEYPELLNTPIVRNQKQASLGYQADLWKTWLDKKSL